MGRNRLQVNNNVIFYVGGLLLTIKIITMYKDILKDAGYEESSAIDTGDLGLLIELLLECQEIVLYDSSKNIGTPSGTVCIQRRYSADSQECFTIVESSSRNNGDEIEYIDEELYIDFHSFIERAAEIIYSGSYSYICLYGDTDLLHDILEDEEEIINHLESCGVITEDDREFLDDKGTEENPTYQEYILTEYYDEREDEIGQK